MKMFGKTIYLYSYAGQRMENVSRELSTREVETVSALLEHRRVQP
jgi:hypothetical protein